MFKFLKSEITYPQRRHPSLEDELRIQVRESAQPGLGGFEIIANWDSRLGDMPLDGLFFTALNQRACILLSLSEGAIPDPNIITDVLNSKNRWALHFSAFLRAKHPILRANLAFPDNPRDPFWLEAPLDLSDGDIQDFCGAAMTDETIDIIVKHQSHADGYYSLAYSAPGVSKVLKNEVRSVVQKFRPELTRDDFRAAYDLLQQIYPSGSAGLERNNIVLLEKAGRARNNLIYFDPYDTPEKREQREREQEENARKETQSEIENYAKKLMNIKDVLGAGDGNAECRALGVEIHNRSGFNGMVAVVDYIRNHYDIGKARSIERAWDGIGEWMG